LPVEGVEAGPQPAHLASPKQWQLAVPDKNKKVRISCLPLHAVTLHGPTYKLSVL